MIKKLPGLTLICFVLFGCNALSVILTDRSGSTLQRAESLFEAGKYSEAVEAYRKALKESPFGPKAAETQYRLAFALSYYKNPQQDYTASFKEYQRVISRYPRSPYRKESENMIFLLSALAAQKQHLSDEQSKTKQMEERLLQLQQLEIEAEQRRNREIVK